MVLFLLLSACGGGGGGGDDNAGNGNDGPTEAELLAELERIFPFTPNQNFDTLYSCARRGSALEYVFDFRGDGTFNLYSTLDTGVDIGPFPGTYTYQNDQLRIQIASIFVTFDEVSTTLTPAMGLIGIFETANMICGAIGHRLNDVATEFAMTVHYDCPNTNIQAVSFDVNAFEFVLQTIQFGQFVPGSAFRARDRFIQGNPNAVIARSNGIYRRVGDRFYILFAPGSFDDVNVLTGTFKNGGLQISVDQLEPERGDCSV